MAKGNSLAFTQTDLLKSDRKDILSPYQRLSFRESFLFDFFTIYDIIIKENN